MMKDLSKIRAFIVNRSTISSRISAYRLGYRWELIEISDKQLLDNLIKEILRHSKKHVLKAFHEGMSHAKNEKKFLLKNSPSKTEAVSKTEQIQIDKEVAKLQKDREEKQQQEKDQSKSR